MSSPRKKSAVRCSAVRFVGRSHRRPGTSRRPGTTSISAKGCPHQQHLKVIKVGFLIVLGAVVLTIFIYASYYSNGALTLPLPLHVRVVSQSPQHWRFSSYQQQHVANSGAALNSVAASSSHDHNHEKNGITSFTRQKQAALPAPHNRLSAIDKGSDEGSAAEKSFAFADDAAALEEDRFVYNDLLEDQYVQNIENILAIGINPPIQKVAERPSAITIETNAAGDSPTDTAGTILTQQIYEAGHENEELNIERLCPHAGIDLKLLILITSAPSHAEARLAIRQTWATYGTRRDVSTAFILGRSTNELLNLALKQENFIYGDMVRGRFIDSYNNLTLKTISALQWVDEHCSHAKYILKTVDDMFINVPRLLNFLDSLAKEKRVIYGQLAENFRPTRNKTSKSYVSMEQFDASVFPPFTTGLAYVISNDTVHDLYVRALHQVYLKLEDVFTTGIVAQQLNITRVNVDAFRNVRIDLDPCDIRNIIGVHLIEAKEQFDLWKNLLDECNLENSVIDSGQAPPVPTANTQKWIENEYTILKNITYMPTTATIEKYPPTQVMSTLHTTPQPEGILTQHIYEAGHANEELDIERLCPHGGIDLKLLIFITSALLHAEERNAIRRTWAHYGTRRDVSTVFMLGRSMNESLNQALTQENFVYRDLVRGSFIDSFNNLTLKTISALQWVDEHCWRAKYILKTDDDMFINVPKLLAFLDSQANEQRVIYGRLAIGWRPKRNEMSKYYVSTVQFGAPEFPPFTTGPAYVMSNDIVHDLYMRALLQVYIKLEDVYTTGIVAEQLAIKRVHVPEFLNRRIDFDPRIVFNPCNIRNIISVHMIKANEQFDLWEKLFVECHINNSVDQTQPTTAVVLTTTAAFTIKTEATDGGWKSTVTPELQTTACPGAPVGNPADTLTQQIYEAGHANEELDIERLCPHGGINLKLLILVSSASRCHVEARLAIRQTWAYYRTRRDVSIAFIIGRSTNKSDNLALTQENSIYGDLVRGNFIESYNNLTLKTVSALQWVDEHCSHAKYVLKTADDVFINVPKLLAFLDSHAKEKRAIYGRLANQWSPIRNKTSKYYVSTEQFDAPVFPPFTMGPAYVMTGDIVHDLYVGALHQAYLKLEDVFTTGIVAQQLGIKRINVNEFLNRRRNAFDPPIVFNSCNIRKIISVMIELNTEEQFDLWNKLRQQCNSVDKISKNITAILPLSVASSKPVEKYPPTADTPAVIRTLQIYEAGHANKELDIEWLCPQDGVSLKLLICITSAQSHAQARNDIRQTWANYNSQHEVSIVFILGRSTNKTVNLALTRENSVYGDLVRGNFIESYDNLTLKTISALQWVVEHCSHAKYILKTVDDMFINVPKLLAFLDSHANEKRVIYGRLAKHWSPKRKKSSKYYVSTKQFDAAVYPPFTTGPAYVMSSDIVHDLYVQALHQVYLKLEDVFTTGIVAQQLGIKRVHVDEFLNRRVFAFKPPILFNPCNVRKIISVMIELNTDEQFDLWKKLLAKCNR